MLIALPVHSAPVAALILMLQTGLMISVGLARGRYRQGIGDGGHEQLALRIRSHGNLAENGAIFLVTLSLLEMLGGEPTAVLALGLGFVGVRVCHAIGLTRSSGASTPRFIGAVGTAALASVTAGYLLVVAATQIKG